MRSVHPVPAAQALTGRREAVPAHPPTPTAPRPSGAARSAVPAGATGNGHSTAGRLAGAGAALAAAGRMTPAASAPASRGRMPHPVAPGTAPARGGSPALPGRSTRIVGPVLEEPIEVARHAGAPEQFLLRERLHVVRAVLAHWTEPGGWRWSGPGAVTAVPVAAGMAVIHSVPVDLADRDVWRVEAAAGMSAALQVFDLCRDTAADPARWTATLVEG